MEASTSSDDAGSNSINVCFFPCIETQADAALCQRYARWALAPLEGGAKIQVILDQDIEQSGLWPDYCVVLDTENALVELKSADKVLVWKSDAFWGAPSWLRRKAIICDPYTSFAATDTLNAWVSSVLGEGDDDLMAPPAFLKLRDACLDTARDILLIGTAPSQSELLATSKELLGNPLCIYMGTAIMNEQLTNIFPPDIIVAADGASQFSSLEPGLAFKARVEAIMESSGCLLVVPASVAGIIKTHWAAPLLSRILTLPTLQPGSQGALHVNQLHDRWAVYPTGNILTTLALPLASSLSRRVRFAGITFQDGKESANSVHWRQADSGKYARQVADVLTYEPGAVLPKANYRTEHFAVLQRMLDNLTRANIVLCDFQGGEITLRQQARIDEKRRSNVLKGLFYWGIKLVDKVQHFPMLLGVFFISVVLSGSMIALAILNINTVLIGLNLACICAIAGTVFFLRLRMNRMFHEIEGRLSRQQAAQFDNLSKRLKAIESSSEEGQHVQDSTGK